jgi:isochorismate hydrolase
MYPDTPIIRRPGEVNAWDNAEVREAVRATNRTQLIIAGITTDVCELTLREPVMLSLHD